MNKQNYFSNKTFITSGEFARLAKSTKRTIQWYTEQGLLKPAKINSKGYRFYTIEQIIDLQVIMLLRNLNFSLPEIKKFMRKSPSTKELFREKQDLFKKQLQNLKKNLKDITNYYQNLETEGVLIKPKIKTTAAFEMYYLDKIGPYAKIYNDCLELKSYFSSIPKNATYLALFPGTQYLPSKDKFKVGVVITKGMKLKKEALGIVKKSHVPPFKSLSYTHIGPAALLSLIIEQAHRYRLNHHIKLNSKIGIHELEFYFKTAINDFHDENNEISEINIPII